MMHPLLMRQLEAAKISVQSEQMEAFLESVSKTYGTYDERIESLLRSLERALDDKQRLYRQSQYSTRERIDAILHVIPDLVLLLSAEGRYLDIYDKGRKEVLFQPKEMMIGKTPYEIFDHEQAKAFDDLLKKTFRTGQVESIRYELNVPKGLRRFEARIIPLPEQNGSEEAAVVIIRDMTDLERSEQNARLLETVFAEATEGVMIEDGDRNVVFVNPTMEKLLGLSSEMCIGKHSTYFSAMLPDELIQPIYGAMETEGYWHGEVELKRFDGTSLLAWLSLDALKDATGNLANVVVMLTDISELAKSREQLEFLATHDALTRLPNRVLLFDRLEHSIATMNRKGGMGALLFLDIDKFKDINDNFGHHIGDQLLIEVANRLKDTVRSSDSIGRFGGDEFLMILEEVEHIDEVLVIIQKIRERLAIPFAFSELELEITMSIGIALIPDDGDDAEMLVNAADRAMYIVKERGRDGFEFYSKDYSVVSHEYFRIQRATRQAIREGLFRIVYQPQFALSDGRLTGAEALLRCDIEDIRDVSVAKLIAIAEESGTIHEIGKIVFDTVCRQIALWQKISLTPVNIAVNLSRRELEREGLPEMVRSSLGSCCVTPMALEFEITESTLMKSSSEARRNIETLRQMGCRFSIDDFGTGYSSLSNLKEFDLDKLKIDKSFIDALVSDEGDQVIVSATISMAKKLGLTVLAEGVETKEQVEVLQEFGCDEVQGFFYSRPVSAEAMTELLQALNA